MLEVRLQETWNDQFAVKNAEKNGKIIMLTSNLLTNNILAITDNTKLEFKNIIEGKLNID